MEFLHFLEGIRSSFGNVFFSACTVLGSEIALIALFAINYWCVDKKFGYEIGASYFMSGLLVQGLKITFRVPRPFVRDPSLTPVESAVSGATGYSFPSAHTQTSASVLIPAAYEYRRHKLFSAFCILLIILTGLSRMYLGVHTPADVVTAFLLTLASTSLIVYERRKHGDKAADIINIILTAGAVISVIYGAVLSAKDIIEYKYLSDCIKSAGACLGFTAGISLERRYADFTPSHHAFGKSMLRLLLGFLGTGIIYCTKLLYEDILFLDGLRYFITVFWITFVYPLIIKKSGKI
ncbi:MAG: phosphatase PAP2 family protein [Oscillospiraceae bacterium]